MFFMDGYWKPFKVDLPMEAMRKVEVLRAACCVSGIDGNASEVERQILDLLAREVGVGRASMEAMISRAETEPDYYQSQFRVLKSDALETIQLLFSVALSDHALAPEEIEVIYRLSQRLGLEEDQFKKVQAQAIQYLKSKIVT